MSDITPDVLVIFIKKHHNKWYGPFSEGKIFERARSYDIIDDVSVIQTIASQ